MQTTDTPVLPALDSADLSLADFRALREGREAAAAKEISPAADAADAAADAETAAETTDLADTLEEQKTEPKPKSDKLNKRFSELTEKIRSLESQLAGKASTGQTETQAAPKVEAAAVVSDAHDLEPLAEKFTDYTDWLKAWNRWDRRQEQRQEHANAQVAAHKSAAEAKASAWQTRVAEAAAELADFATVAQNPDLPVTPVMAEAITDSELGAKILYALGQDPALAAKIAKLSPVAQVREIGKLEKALEAAAPAAADDDADTEPLPKKTIVSKAPAPHKAPGGAAAVSPSKNLDAMTQAEYRAYREAGKIR